MGDGIISVGAKNQTDRRILIGMRPMLFGVIAVKVHLTGVGMSKFSGLQVDYDQAAQPAMEQ